MHLVPLRTALLVSDLPPGEVAALLRASIGDEPAPFAGTAGPDGFVVSRLREYRSTAMPFVRGRLAAAPGGGTEIRLRLRPPDVVVVFMGIWLGFLGAAAALVLFAHALHAGRGLLLLLVPAGLAAGSWFLMLSVFAADARWTLECLARALPALGVPGGGREGNSP